MDTQKFFIKRNIPIYDYPVSQGIMKYLNEHNHCILDVLTDYKLVHDKPLYNYMIYNKYMEKYMEQLVSWSDYAYYGFNDVNELKIWDEKI